MTTTFLQSEVQDPYKIYETMLSNNPIYWDNENKLWAIYAYEHCKALLINDSVDITAVNMVGLNKYAVLITEQLARLSNGIQHEIARKTAKLLFEKMHSFSIGNLFEKLLKSESKECEIDWVSTICKKIPINIVLKCFDFNDFDCDLVCHKIEILIKIMMPNKTNEQLIQINEVSKQIYLIAENHINNVGFFEQEITILSNEHNISKDKVLSFAVSNLIGLFIQSYDASRGLISNSLLQVLKSNIENTKVFNDENYLKKIVVETLRFDPPIHNTRRIVVEDIKLKDFVLKKGELIFIVLASANRDPQKFANAIDFNVERPNNSENLTFGFGGHHCLAKYFSIDLTVKCLSYLFHHYPNVKLLDEKVQYEPMINARLPKQMFIFIS